MTLKVEVEVPFDMIQNGGASMYLRSAMSAIGYSPTASVSPATLVAAAPAAVPIVENDEPTKETHEDKPKGRGRPRKADTAETKARADEALAKAETAQISTGEARVGPEDDPETEAQDEADEVAERGAETKATLTHDDVRGALGAYVKKYGMPAAQEDGPRVIALMFGEGKVKVSDIPDDQESLAKAVAGVQEMLTKNPFKRDAI